MPKEPKTVRLALRLGETEAGMLDELATATGHPVSTLIRDAVRAFYATHPSRKARGKAKAKR